MILGGTLFLPFCVSMQEKRRHRMPSKVGEKFELDDSSWEFEAGVPLAPSHQYHLLPGSSHTGTTQAFNSCRRAASTGDRETGEFGSGRQEPLL
jgi:hypothetical protein